MKAMTYARKDSCTVGTVSIHSCGLNGFESTTLWPVPIILFAKWVGVEARVVARVVLLKVKMCLFPEKYN